MGNAFVKYFKLIERNYYIVLLTSLFLFLFIVPIADYSLLGEILADISILLVGFSGYILVPPKNRTIFFKILFSFISLGLILSIIGVQKELRFFSLACWIIFFFKVFYQIFKLSLKKEHPPKESLINSISGYLVLGVMGAIVFVLIQHLVPGSFNTQLSFDELIYYSFVTMSTLGYGDLLPVSEVARYAAIVLTLTGQLYIAVVIALNLAKYMSLLNSKEDQHEKQLTSIEKKLNEIDEKLNKK